MALGYCEALLLHLRSIAGDNYPGTKVTPPGFTQMLIDNPDRPQTIGEAFTDGHKKSVRIKYKVRSVVSQVSTSRSCDYNIVPAYKETTASVNQFVQLGLRIDDETIRNYCKDASASVQVGTPPTALMAEHLDSILHAMNGLYQKMDEVLLTSMQAQFGVNVRTGNNALATININKQLNVQSLNDGLVQILADYEDNELNGQPLIVGSGLFRNLVRMQPFRQPDLSGISIQKEVNEFKFYYDRKASSIFGVNAIGVFAPGSVHLIEYMKNVGSFAGQKGLSTKATMTDPYYGVRWDIQFKYVDCPTEVTNAYTGSTSTIDEGWILIISKNYDLFVNPADAFDGADTLAGVNGTLHYTISNDCDNCD